MSGTATIVVTLERMECSECCATYAVTDKFKQARRRDHRTFWCPYCGSQQYFPGESDVERADRLRKKAEDDLQRERQQHDQTKAALKDADKRLVSQKAATTRIKKRVGNGVCPCCKRSFGNLMRHMQSQHPGYAEEKSGS